MMTEARLSQTKSGNIIRKNDDAAVRYEGVKSDSPREKKC